MTPINIKKLKYACYTTNVAMSVVANLSPVLFITFHRLYGISYSLLGALVLINFFVQMVIDLIFSFFSHKFNIPAVVKSIPVLTAAGLVIYAAFPLAFPDKAYLGLVLGTLVFSASGGFSEVLMSPVIAALPADDPDREMSKLHSVYAWGVVGIVVFSTLFLGLFGRDKWQLLVFLLAVIPLVSVALFAGTRIPDMETPKKASGALSLICNKGVILCFVAMFLGGASELIMGQWASGYLEQAVGIPKMWGDIFGVALFSVFLGLGRSMYASIGKNIERVLIAGALGATICYLAAALSNAAWLGLAACAFTGFCVSMMWPGMLIVSSERFGDSGVFIFALMAAGGDMGASVGPQLVGIITDAVIANPSAVTLSQSLSLTPEQLGMKLAMLVGMLFPLTAVAVYIRIYKTKNRK